MISIKKSGSEGDTLCHTSQRIHVLISSVATRCNIVSITTIFLLLGTANQVTAAWTMGPSKLASHAPKCGRFIHHKSSSIENSKNWPSVLMVQSRKLMVVKSSLDENNSEEGLNLSTLLGELEKEGEEPKLLPTKGNEDTNDDGVKSKPESERSRKISPPKKKKRSKREIKKFTYLLDQSVEELLQEGEVDKAIARAEQNIETLQNLFDESGIRWYKPNVHTYNVYIRAVSKKRPDGAEKAQKILDTLPLRPNVGTYSIVISAYASSRQKKDKSAAEQALKLLYELIDLMQQQNTESTTTTLQSNHTDENHGDEYEDSLDKSLDHTESSFVPEGDLCIACDAVLNVWAKHGTIEAAERCETILERMEYLRRSSSLNVQPTTYSFATVIKAWANAKDADGTQRAERANFILQQLAKNYQDCKDNHFVAPDTVIFNSVIDAWAKSGDPRCGVKGEELLKQMLELSSNKNSSGKSNTKQISTISCRPDIITYNTVINCWSNSGHVNAAKESERILKQMEKQMQEHKKNEGSEKNSQVTEYKRTENGDRNWYVAPNQRTYNSVLKAYSKSRIPGAPKRAFAILNYMLQSGREEIQPDVVSFTTVLDVWAKSKEENKAVQAQAILHKMRDFHIQTGDSSLRPNEMTYNAVLNACAFSAMASSEEQKQALKVALITFKELSTPQNNVSADSITYGTLLKCMANLIPKGNPSRVKMSCDLFERCCNEGMVGEMAWNEFRRTVSRKILIQTLKTKLNAAEKSVSNMQLRNLPIEWTCNVSEAKVYRSNKHRKNQKKNGYSRKKGSSADSPKPRNQHKGSEDITTPKPIRPMRSIRETSWISGKDV